MAFSVSSVIETSQTEYLFGFPYLYWAGAIAFILMLCCCACCCVYHREKRIRKAVENERKLRAIQQQDEKEKYDQRITLEPNKNPTKQTVTNEMATSNGSAVNSPSNTHTPSHGMMNQHNVFGYNPQQQPPPPLQNINVPHWNQAHWNQTQQSVHSNTYSHANDRANFLALVQELRSAFGTKYLLTVASQADVQKANAGFNIAEMSKVIDAWNIMAYDYTVSADTDASFAVTAPNQPLWNPNVGPLPNDSVSTTIDGYIAAGASADQLVVGIAYYGHTWYLPGLVGDEWKQMGQTGQIQGECCGPMKQTYGAKYAKYYQECGSYMYSDIMNAGFETFYDNATGTNIGYMNGKSKDGWTAEGVWIAYQGKESVHDIVEFAQGKGLRGAFSFDISQDSFTNGFDFELTEYISSLYN